MNNVCVDVCSNLLDTSEGGCAGKSQGDECADGSKVGTCRGNETLACVVEEEKCASMRKGLETKYLEARDALIQEVDGLQRVVDDTSCEDGATDQYKAALEPVDDRQKKVSLAMSRAFAKVTQLKPELERLTAAHAQLMQRVTTTQEECKAGEDTKTSLLATAKVLDAMGECARAVEAPK
jgi:hypothetical protein